MPKSSFYYYPLEVFFKFLQVLIVDLILRRGIPLFAITILEKSISIAALVTMLHSVASHLTWLVLLLREYLSLHPLSHEAVLHYTAAYVRL